ncbi:MAG: hypothetical protein EXQ70_07400 [Solirubrobacterales bacterium]|nr:hypothetical protein [Solirubrobacterales bacterium]
MAGVAMAGPVTIAFYRFSSSADVDSFAKVKGSKCEKKLRGGDSMGVTVGQGTNACGYRSSVVADSSSRGASLEMSASTNLTGTTPAKLRKKIYLGVAVRQSDNEGYELRILPGVQKWQVFRDAKGSGGSALFASGPCKCIRPAAGKPNDLVLRAFKEGSDVRVRVAINRKVKLNAKDTAGNQPAGRRTVLLLGAKGNASAKNAVGAFDNVAVRVPSPF